MQLKLIFLNCIFQNKGTVNQHIFVQDFCKIFTIFFRCVGNVGQQDNSGKMQDWTSFDRIFLVLTIFIHLGKNWAVVWSMAATKNQIKLGLEIKITVMNF